MPVALSHLLERFFCIAEGLQIFLRPIINTNTLLAMTRSNPPQTLIPKRYVFPQVANSFQGKFTRLGFRLFFGKTPKPSAKRVDEFAHYHMASDELADQVVDELFKQMHPRDGRQLLAKAVEQGLEALDTEAVGIPNKFRELLQQAETLPAWYNHEKIELAYHVVHRCGRFGMYALGDFALLGGYSNSDISKPLAFTGALNGSSSFDRVSETTSLWLDVTEPSGLQRGAKGYQSAVKVRVMHALIRQKLNQHPEWQNEEWGLPINSADAVATNVGFSMVMLLGCKMIGMRFTDEETEAVLHLWKYIGYLMGDPADWLPETAQEGVDALYLIALANRIQPDEDSIELARSYLESFKEVDEPDTLLPKGWYKRGLYYFHRAYAAYFIPLHIYRALKLPFAWGTQLLVLAQMPYVFCMETLYRLSPSMRLAREKRGRKGQEYIVNSRLQGREVTYQEKQQMAK